MPTFSLRSIAIALAGVMFIQFVSQSRLSAATFDDRYRYLAIEVRSYGIKHVTRAGIGSDIPAVADCLASAMFTGIPDANLSVMESYFESRQSVMEARKKLAKWFGPTFVHGPAKHPSYEIENDGIDYEDGTARDREAERVVSERLASNAQSICPALLEKYPRVFRY